MATFEFKLPDLGEGVAEGELVKWHVKEGDLVKEDQVLCEVMTDKATVTVPTPHAGRVVKTHGREGDMAKVHQLLVTMELEGSAPAAQAPASHGAPAAPAGLVPAAQRLRARGVVVARRGRVGAQPARRARWGQR